MRGEKMKKEYMLALLALWFMAAGTVVIADAGGKTKAGKTVIHRYEADVTGDGKRMRLYWKASRLQPAARI